MHRGYSVGEGPPRRCRSLQVACGTRSIRRYVRVWLSPHQASGRRYRTAAATARRRRTLALALESVLDMSSRIPFRRLGLWLGEGEISVAQTLLGPRESLAHGVGANGENCRDFGGAKAVDDLQEHAGGVVRLHAPQRHAQGLGIGKGVLEAIWRA